ncbi:hypothetical protein [Clostridium perfringens]|uniref:hypothetical protein n=1 Tax=Clostridium perfringens TaxID=1502 RepID=UPI0018E485E7|nr:hypothetical protein [Clostridium perfringens]MBI5993969.1 hypothetical protein [Clostridium perfringens]
MDNKNDSQYVIKEGEYTYKVPQKPKASDYYDVLETDKEREERIFLYSEVN